MKRIVKVIPIGDGWNRYRLTLEDDGSTPETSGHALVRFIQTLADQPLLMRCGAEYFESAKLFHSGSAWVLQAEMTAKTGEGDLFERPERPAI